MSVFLKTIDRGNPVGFADAAFRGGATMVIGHGPHVLRAAEWRGDRLALYSLGNLLTYGPFKLREPTNRGVVACAAIDSVRHVASAELRPTMQLWPGVLQADSTQSRLEADRFAEPARFSEDRRARRLDWRAEKTKATLRSPVV